MLLLDEHPLLSCVVWIPGKGGWGGIKLICLSKVFSIPEGKLKQSLSIWFPFWSPVILVAPGLHIVQHGGLPVNSEHGGALRCPVMMAS
jgi:hypothetical protein